MFTGTHLINQADSSTTNIFLPTWETNFKSLSFTIGVDSLYNVSGVQTGDLDPVKGMFWTWNSGYIMAKLEGTSPVSSQPNNNFEFHIGGYKAGQNTVQKIILDLPENLLPANASTGVITIAADANKWFSAVHELRIATQPVCTQPGKLSVAFSENYAQMFSIVMPN